MRSGERERESKRYPIAMLSKIRMSSVLNDFNEKVTGKFCLSHTQQFLCFFHNFINFVIFIVCCMLAYIIVLKWLNKAQRDEREREEEINHTFSMGGDTS